MTRLVFFTRELFSCSCPDMETTELLETATAPYDVFEEMSSCVGREKGNGITTRGNINQCEYENREKK